MKVLGRVDAARTRFLKQGGVFLYFAVPTSVTRVPTLCLVAVRRTVASASGCGPVADAVKEDKPPEITNGDVTGVFLPDGSSDLRFMLANGVGSVSPTNGLYAVLTPGSRSPEPPGRAPPARAISVRPAPSRSSPPADGVSKALEALPVDALAKARRAALIAVDRFYPQATRATVETAARATETPCSAAITDRSIEVSLRLAPGSPKTGRLLAGMKDGYMRVFYLLR